jgi:hypothetical protein
MRPASSTNNDRVERTSVGLPASNSNGAALVLSVVIGATLGVLLGFFSMAGAMAVVLGLVLGAVGGFLVGKIAIGHMRRQSARDQVLDREIGVIDGDLGA